MTLTTETAKTLLDQLPVGLGVWDAGDAQTPYDMRLVYANPWSLQHLLGGIPLPAGQTVREIEGIEIEGVYGRGANKEFIDGVFASARDQVARTIELGHPDGSVYRIHYLPVGNFVTASIFEDITAVSEANMKLSMALESAKAGMWVFDYSRNTQSWDGGASSLTGVSDVVELANTSLDTLLSCISLKDRKDVESLLTRTLETPGALHAELEFRIVRPMMQQITVMDRVRITREEGKATQALHVLIDITDKAHLTAQLQQSNSDLKNFAHVASHDLREPLRVIANYVTLLFEEYGDRLTDPGAQQYRGFIETSATRAMALVEDLLHFSRAGNNVNLRTTNLDRLVQIATENLKVAIDETGARVTTGVMPQVTCDAAMMVQVLQNLIGNAVKFSASGAPPEVLVTAEDKGAHWLVSVKDNGIGIDPQYLQKIFTPFYRLYSTAEYAGTGIGLALCHKIVRAHGGEIWAESGGQGQGTTLLFTLPKAA